MRETRTPYSKPKLKQKERRKNENQKQINPNQSYRSSKQSMRMRRKRKRIAPSEDKKTSGLGNNEYQSAKKGESWKFRLRSTIRRAMEKCGTKEAFINYMRAAGYEVSWNDQYKNIKYICTGEPKYKNGDGANAKSLIHQISHRRIKRRSVQAA